MKKIFISYRRSDSAADAGRLNDRLEKQYGDPNVFMDVDDIRPGEKFEDAIERRIARCDTLILMIGPGWANATNQDGARRLDDPNDLARQEVETALRKGLRVIPILVRGAELPKADELPESLQPILGRNAVKITHANFQDDVDSLITRLGGKIKDGKTSNRKGILIGAAGTVAVLLAIGWAFAPEDDVVDAPPPQPFHDEPAPARAVNLTGTWYDNLGQPYYLAHEGNDFEATALDVYTGEAIGKFWGTFDGFTLRYDWEYSDGERGNGGGNLEPDGNHLSVSSTNAFSATESTRLHREHPPH